MITLLSQITFMQPIILGTLLALPLLWFFLRVTPPAPKTIIFPAYRFLAGLIANENFPSKSPWWILLLRLAIIALIIIALARPVINQADRFIGNGSAAVRIIIDNGWASAANWNAQISAAEEIISQASREQREIYIVTTAPAIGEVTIKQHGALSYNEAAATLRGLSPNSWGADYDAFIKSIANNKNRKSIYSIWLSHGLNEGGIDKAISTLQRQGGLSYISPTPSKMPLLLRPTKKIIDGDTAIDIEAPANIIKTAPISVKVMAQKGDIIDIKSIKLDAGLNTATFDVLESLKNRIAKFQISNHSGAGAVFILDDQSKRRKVGIAAQAGKELSAPLIEASYYIKRALEPFADITINEIDKLIDANMSVIIMPDIAAMPTQTLNNLEKWVNDGGLLLRFAGDNMAKSRAEHFLTPVKLRSGGRALLGSLSWDEKQNIAPFSEDSPFYGLDIPDDITIKQYILADPNQDFEGKIWAKLSDGTPFITAAGQEKGLVALIHTSANASWSDFALSGLYVSVLKRVVRLAGQGKTSNDSSYSSLDPLLVMDGYGVLTTPPASVKPIAAGDLTQGLTPSSIHPAGLYGHGKMQYALNIGTNIAPLKLAENLPSSVAQYHYESEGDYEINLMPSILYAALILFLIDWFIMIFIAGNGFKILRKYASIMLILIPSTSFAASNNIEYASGFHLAYIETGDSNLDDISYRGLSALGAIMARRTSVETMDVIAINPENDEMAFFPLIYWAIGDNQKEYSSKALSNIQYYLDHGGTILFDTLGQNSANITALRRITASLNIPAIEPISKDHVLGRSFYLLDKYVGKHSSGTLWVEKQSASGRDNVSSVIIGSNDFAGEWAKLNNNTRNNEMSMRFGINLVMYALTGNYKADQVHIPHILKRLGK